jgi:hypothetical protein
MHTVKVFGGFQAGLQATRGSTMAWGLTGVI